MLTISHYTKTYPGGKTAVEDLSLHIPAGELCGFIGHNGAGKTTTLRAVAGVMSFTQGTIAIDGHDVRTDPVAAKAVTAFLPDNPDLYEFMSGIEYPILCVISLNVMSTVPTIGFRPVFSE